MEFVSVLGSCRFLQLTGETVQTNVYNTEVKNLISHTSEGGVVPNIDASHKCNILLINTLFRNGFARSKHGGAVSVRAPKLTTIIIQNSTIQRFSNKDNLGIGWGGVMFITFDKGIHSDGMVSLKILNSSFLDNFSENGGAITAFARVSLTVVNSIFMKNTAYKRGGSLYLNLGSNSTVILRNVSFIGNIAGHDGGSIFIFIPTFHAGSFVAFKNVNFTENEAGIAGGAIIVLFSSNVAIAFENVIFTENTAKYQGTAIGLEQSVVSEGIGHLVFHKCEFIGNYGYYGAVRLQGRYSISCQSSTFLSNFALYVCGGLSLELENSMVRISNSFFSSNSCWYSSGGALGIFAKNNTNAIITDSTFINNNAYNGTGGAISFLGSADEVNKTNCHDPLVPRSWNYKNSVEI